MSIIGMKLVTGEDVIGEAGITKDGQIQVSQPVQIKLLPSHLLVVLRQLDSHRGQSMDLKVHQFY